MTDSAKERSKKLVFNMEGKTLAQKEAAFFALQQAGYHWFGREINVIEDATISYSVICIYPSDKEITYGRLHVMEREGYVIFDQLHVIYMVCDFTMYPDKYKQKQHTQFEIDVAHQDHYESQCIEPIEYMKANFSKEAFRGFLHGNIQKYLTRHEKKNGLEDLRKAKVYLEWLINDWEEK